MANALYTPYKEAALGATINLPTDTIKAVLVDTALYTFSAAHQFLSDIAVGARVATSGALLSKTITGGVFDAADITIVGVTGASIEAVAVFKDSGVATTSPLIAFIDQTPVPAAISLTPNGGDITIVWDNGANKIFKL